MRRERGREGDTRREREKGWKEAEVELVILERLIEASSVKAMAGDRTPKGYVPILVGKDAKTERFLLHVKLFSHPRIVELLEKTAEELGYKQEGILKIPCDVDHFRQVIRDISKAN